MTAAMETESTKRPRGDSMKRGDEDIKADENEKMKSKTTEERNLELHTALLQS